MSINDYIYWQTKHKTGKTPDEIWEYEHPKVVRCKECKNYNDGDCTELPKLVGDDDYCSFGERREE